MHACADIENDVAYSFGGKILESKKHVELKPNILRWHFFLGRVSKEELERREGVHSQIKHPYDKSEDINSRVHLSIH